MANMYPSELDRSVVTSEQTVYDVLRDGLSGDWHVIHGRRFTLPPIGDGHAIEGELDFLVVQPNGGVLGLEVKGGQEIGSDHDGWFSVPSNDPTVRHQIKDPGAQAQRAIRNLLRYVNTQTQDPELKALRPSWGVAFPGMVSTGGLGPGLPASLIMGRNHLQDPEQALQRMYEYHTQEFWTEDQAPLLPPEALAKLIDILMPRFSLVAAPGPAPQPIRGVQQRREEARKRILRLTDEQLRILDSSEDLKRVSVTGHAGTGKTILAIEQARRLADRGRRVLFLCYNRNLADHLQGTGEGIEVTNFHRLCHKVVTDAGQAFNPPRSAQRAKFKSFWDETAAEHLLFVLEEEPGVRWDAVIVDEGQDFKDSWWIPVQELLDSPEDGELWVFSDPSQNLYEGGSLEGLGLSPLKLLRNVRNTRQIAEKSYGYADLKPVLGEGIAVGRPPEEVLCSHEHDMVEEVRKKLHHLINVEGVLHKNIVVLSHRARKSKVWQTRRFGNVELVDHGENQGPGTVIFSSIQAFKGLEADVVILCDAQLGETSQLMYVGSSRAKHTLIVLAVS